MKDYWKNTRKVLIFERIRTLRDWQCARKENENGTDGCCSDREEIAFFLWVKVKNRSAEALIDFRRHCSWSSKMSIKSRFFTFSGDKWPEFEHLFCLKTKCFGACLAYPYIKEWIHLAEIATINATRTILTINPFWNFPRGLIEKYHHLKYSSILYNSKPAQMICRKWQVLVRV